MKNTKKRMLKILIAFLSAIYLILISLIIVLYTVFLKDEPEFNDSHLMPIKRKVLPEENAFKTLLLASEKVIYTKNKNEIVYEILDEKRSWDKKFIDKLLSENKEALRLLKDAIRMKHLQVPEVRIEDKCSYIVRWYYLAKVYALQIRNLFNQGKEKEAFEEAIGLIRFGDMIRKSAVTVLHYAIGITVMKLGFETINLFLEKTTLTNNQLMKYERRLDGYNINGDYLINALKFKYLSCVKYLESLSKMEVEPLFFKFNQTKKLFYDMYEQIIKNAKSYYCEIKSAEKELKRKKNKNKLKYLKNIAGYKIVELMTGDENIVFYKCKTEAYIYFTQISLAVKCYKNENEKYPDSFKDLIPKYMKKIPNDPFDGKKIRYNKKKKILYSVGRNLIDDGGDRKKDYVFSINY